MFAYSKLYLKKKLKQNKKQTHVTLRLCHNTRCLCLRHNTHKFYGTTSTYPEESRKRVPYFLHYLSEIKLIGTEYILSLILPALKIILKVKSVLPMNLKKSNMLQEKIFRLTLIKSIRRRKELVKNCAFVLICIFFLQIYILYL